MLGLLTGAGSLLTAATPLAGQLGSAYIQTQSAQNQAQQASANAQILAQQSANSRANNMQTLLTFALIAIGGAFAIKALKSK
mgnify:CR=1 FL=1